MGEIISSNYTPGITSNQNKIDVEHLNDIDNSVEQML